MIQQIQPYQQPQPYQPLQVEAQFWQGVVSFLMATLLAVYVLSQIIKVFRGEEVAKPL